MQSAWIALGAAQLAALILWTTPSAVRTRTSLAAAALTPLSTLGLCLLSYAEHGRAVRPSSILNSYLFATLLFDISHARTLWLRAADHVNHIIAYVSAAAVVAKAFVLVLEALEKRRLLRPEYRAYPPEATSSIYSRSFFWWLNPLFRLGFSRVLDVDDLFVLDKHLQASYCHRRFREAWTSGGCPLRLIFFYPLFRGHDDMFAHIIGVFSCPEVAVLSSSGVIWRTEVARAPDYSATCLPHGVYLLSAISHQPHHQAITGTHHQ